MRFQAAALALLSIAAGGCGPSQQARIRAYEQKESHCIQLYRSGDIQTAKQALLDYLHLVEEEEASGLPFTKTAWSKALAAARLTLICRQLGDTELANQYIQKTIAWARKDAQEEGNKSWLEKTDEQVQVLMTNAVNKLDENTPPNWRLH